MESNHRPPPYQGGALPTELREQIVEQTAQCNGGAGDGNRTRASSLEGYSSTIELLPHREACLDAPPAGKACGWNWWREVDGCGAPFQHPAISQNTYRQKLVEGGGWLRRGAPWPCGLRLRRTQQGCALLSNQRWFSPTSDSPFQHPAMSQNAYRQNWWREVDSNHRRRKPADLQSAPVGRLGIPPNISPEGRERPSKEPVILTGAFRAVNGQARNFPDRRIGKRAMVGREGEGRARRSWLKPTTAGKPDADKARASAAPPIRR